MSHPAAPLDRPDLPDYQRFAARLTAVANCAPRTAKSYAQVSRLAVDWFTINKPGKPLLELTPEDIEDYIIALDQRGLATGTRRSAVYALRKLYTYIGRTSTETINPAAQVKAPVQLSKRPEPWDTGELNRLLAGSAAAARNATTERALLRARFDHAVLATFRYTGLRLNELVDLDTAHIRLERRSLEVHHGKGGKQRFVPIPVPLARILRTYLDEVRPLCPASSRLFANPSGYDGTGSYGKLANRAAFAIVVKYAEAAGLDGTAHPHRLRHSWATDHYRKGTALHVISSLLGHASILTTVRYLGLTKNDLTIAVDAAYRNQASGEDPQAVAA